MFLVTSIGARVFSNRNGTVDVSLSFVISSIFFAFHFVSRVVNGFAGHGLV